MTTQISDLLNLRGSVGIILQVLQPGKSHGLPYIMCPEDFGMRGQMTNTSNRRGFSAQYEIADRSLYLAEFWLCERSGNYQPIGDATPQLSPEGDAAAYTNIDLPIRFSGIIQIQLVGRPLDLVMENGELVVVDTRPKRVFPKW